MALSFNAPIDIANRALQHCGAPRIDATLGFQEDSKQALETAFVYDKLRRAELRRNVWRFSIREARLRAVTPTTARVDPLLWSSLTNYGFGELVADVTGSIWSSVWSNNLDSQPGVGSLFEPYYGPLTADLYSSSETYSVSDLVYTVAANHRTQVYRSLINDNADDPRTVKTYDATVTYRKTQVVVHSAVNYQSLIDFNAGNTPSAAPALWSAITTYAIGNSVGASDGFIYTSLINGNIGNDPSIDDGTKWQNTGNLNPWTTVITSGVGSFNWMPIAAVLNPLPIIYPINTGPNVQTQNRNVFWLPGNFLRQAPIDPKSGSISWLGAPGNLPNNDWRFESKFIVSAESGPLMLRFAADITDVTMMDEMFCEGLAARVALAVCEPLTQSDSKLQSIGMLYRGFMSEARLINAIETGPFEPPLDDFIACRA
jgi:hypothetical protein